MVIGILLVHLYLPDSDSLKAKRQIIHSLKARLKNQFNISISEISMCNRIKEAKIGITCISNDGRCVDSQFSQIMKKINANSKIEVIDYSTQKI